MELGKETLQEKKRSRSAQPSETIVSDVSFVSASAVSDASEAASFIFLSGGVMP